MDIVKSYFIISLIFILASYILPNAAYRKYIKYFIGIMMSVMILKSINSILNADTKDNASAKASEITNKIETTIQENNIDNNQNDKNSEVVENIKSKTENEIIDFEQSNNFSDNTDKTEEDNSHIEGIDYSLLEDWS